MVPRSWSCAVCKVVCSGSSLCGGCRKVAYCGKDHQAEDRPVHRPHCFYPFIQSGGVEVTQLLQFNIALLPEEIKPKIWRRIQVPMNYNFGQFHRAIQIAFDWHSVDYAYHTHQFSFDGGELRGLVFGPKNAESVDSMFAMFHNKGNVLDERKKYLKDYFKGPATVAVGSAVDCIYLYDFGDRWYHTIKYEGEFPAEANVKYPLCLAGERAGIPEDSSNSDGYERICNIIKNPEHKEYKETMDWLKTQGKPNYNPDSFHTSEIIFD